jgi:hypothetical protein
MGLSTDKARFAVPTRAGAVKDRQVLGLNMNTLPQAQ